jgi:hypothetical protein
VRGRALRRADARLKRVHEPCESLIYEQQSRISRPHYRPARWEPLLMAPAAGRGRRRPHSPSTPRLSSSQEPAAPGALLRPGTCGSARCAALVSQRARQQHDGGFSCQYSHGLPNQLPGPASIGTPRTLRAHCIPEHRPSLAFERRCRPPRSFPCCV